MRIAEYKQISTRLINRIIHHDALWDDNGNIVANAWDEVVEVQVPVMGTVYRDASPDEIDEMERQQAEYPPPEPTPEERIAKLEAENAHLIEALELILSGATEVNGDG